MLRFLFTSLLLIATGSAGYYYYQLQQAPITVTTFHAQQEKISSYVRISGSVVNDRVVKLAALVSGEIQTLAVNVGDHVKKGQRLVSFDNTVNLHQIKRAKSEVELQTQSLYAAQSRLKRLFKLSHSGAIAREKLDQAQTDKHIAQARLDIAKENLIIEQLRLKKTKLYAPYAGVITEKLTGTGQWTEAGTLLLVLASDNDREIEAQVDAGDFLNIKIGKKVSISADSHPDKTWTGTIRRLSPAVSKSSSGNTFPIRISLDKNAPQLLLNQQVNVKLTIASKDKALTVPLAALIEKNNAYQLMTVADGKIKKVDVTTGIESYTHIEIIKGIDETTLLVEANDKNLKNGETVSVNNKTP